MNNLRWVGRVAVVVFSFVLIAAYVYSRSGGAPAVEPGAGASPGPEVSQALSSEAAQADADGSLTLQPLSEKDLLMMMGSKSAPVLLPSEGMFGASSPDGQGTKAQKAGKQRQIMSGSKSAPIAVDPGMFSIEDTAPVASHRAVEDPAP